MDFALRDLFHLNPVADSAGIVKGVKLCLADRARGGAELGKILCFHRTLRGVSKDGAIKTATVGTHKHRCTGKLAKRGELRADLIAMVTGQPTTEEP